VPPTPVAFNLSTSLADARALVDWLEGHESQQHTLGRMTGVLVECLRGSGRILSCGNGGSMCDAMHFAEELSGRNREDRPALSAQAMSDPGHLTCVANDYGFEQVFARGVEAWARSGDVLLLFSTSGRSRNLIRAAEAARSRQVSRAWSARPGRWRTQRLMRSQPGRARCDIRSHPGSAHQGSPSAH
jgi:D-sedoheptulose 7-phosphate isomerase